LFPLARLLLVPLFALALLTLDHFGIVGSMSRFQAAQGDTACEATSDEVKELKAEGRQN
jgi:hypothetical protein